MRNHQITNYKLAPRRRARNGANLGSMGITRNGTDGSSSVDDSSLWTEEFDELEYISLMDDDLEVLPLEPMLAPSRAPPPFGEGAVL